MKTFNDYSELEKANLTEVEVQALLKYELMELGIVKPSEPELLPEDEAPVLQSKVYYQPYLKSYSGLCCAFATAKEAEAFLKLNPLILESEYPSYVSTVESPKETKVESVQAISKADFSKSESQLNKAKKNKEKNETATNSYNEEVKKSNDATSYVWDEWMECGRKKKNAEKVLELYDQYLEDCEGNEEIAVRFLGKVYSVNEIRNAYEFLEQKTPSSLLISESQPEPTEVPA